MRRPLGLNNKAYEVLKLAKPQEVKDGVRDQDGDPLTLRPTVELYKLPSGIASWVHIDINSNAMDRAKNDLGDRSESRDLFDNDPGMQMATLNQHIDGICGETLRPPVDSGRVW